MGSYPRICNKAAQVLAALGVYVSCAVMDIVNVIQFFLKKMAIDELQAVSARPEYTGQQPTDNWLYDTVS